jgi:hypothetical protein
MFNVLKQIKFSKFNFSTLIVPEILGNKIHPSVYNLMSAAKQVDTDVSDRCVNCFRIKYSYTARKIILMTLSMMLRKLDSVRL